MKKSLVYLLLIIVPYSMYGQVGEWTWIKGDSTDLANGTWGMMGVPDINVNPPGLYEGCEWRDKQGNFWMFGGIHGNISYQHYSALWKYSVVTNTWTWIKGSQNYNQSGIYGIQGIPDSANSPGGRGFGITSWIDSSNNLWLFGGHGYDSNGNLGDLNDLWRYNISTNEWTFMKGSSVAGNLGNFGIQGLPSLSNNPPCEAENACSWKDSKNNLWLFSGGSLSSPHYRNDLWLYQITSNTWTWMKGDYLPNQSGEFGLMGVASSTNNPSSRWAYAHWIDKQDNLWLFGGNGYDSTGHLGFLSDMWKFNTTTTEWTWMNGSAIKNQEGMFGSYCAFQSSNAPENRCETRAYWTDQCGHFFMYGGQAWQTYNIPCDLWVYDISLNQWALLKGDTINSLFQGYYGIKGVSSPLNQPGCRMGSLTWVDSSENLWLFSGQLNRNDLWRFLPDYSCIGNGPCSVEANFFVSSKEVCEKFCLNFFDSSSNNPTSWVWQFPGGDPSSSTNQNPTNICYNNPGVYDVTIITTNAFGNDTLTLSNYITVYSTPPFPTITQVGYTLTSSFAITYQWQLSAVDISGATNQSYTVTQSGYYTVIVSDSNGCVNSASLKVTISGIDGVENNVNILIYPNPSSGNFIVELPKGFMTGEISIDIMNALGQKVFSSEEKASSSRFKKEIDMSDIARGVYFIEIRTENIFLNKKIIILK